MNQLYHHSNHINSNIIIKYSQTLEFETINKTEEKKTINNNENMTTEK